jgi:hypothetical protein
MTDPDALKSLDLKISLIRDRVRSVAAPERWQKGLYVWGPGGTSKSYTVEKTLTETNSAYKLTNSRLTGAGLFELLDEYPDVVHVLDDVETLFADKTSHGVLRSALWGENVTWHTAKARDGRREVKFSGGIILIANSPLENVPALAALSTRISEVRFLPTTDELGAMMRKIAEHGHHHGVYRLSPAECREVAEEVIGRSRRMERNLDLRLYVNTCQDRLQYQNGAAETHWTDLLESRLQRRTVTPTAAPEDELIKAIRMMPAAQRLAVWKNETGKSQATLYRRLSDSSHEKN